MYTGFLLLLFCFYLDLSGNDLRDAGAECVAELLRRNDSIVHLSLKSNDIGYIGGIALAHAMESNVTLTSLDLSGTNVMLPLLMLMSDQFNEEHC